MTPEELSKLPHYDYYTNMKAAHPDASDQLCRAFADAMKGYLYGTQEALDAFAWFWKGWARSSGARTIQTEELRIPDEFKQIASFYDVEDMAALVRIQEERIEDMRKKLPPTPPFPGITRVREG